MSYENIELPTPNMAFDGATFCCIDDSLGMFSKKSSGGKVIFQYPLDYTLNFSILTELGPTKSLQFDGIGFWSLNVLPTNDGIVIRYWILSSALCVLKKQFILNNYVGLYGEEIEYNTSKTFSIESYITKIKNDFSHGSTFIILEEYYDKFIFENTDIFIGPNFNKDYEKVTVIGTDADKVYLSEPLRYDYKENTTVTIIVSLFIFSDFNGGSLIKHSTFDGSFIQISTNTDYSLVNSSKFSRIIDKIPENYDVYTIAYSKDTSIKLLNMSNLLGASAATSATDNFENELDLEKWDVTYGQPTTSSGNLVLNTPSVGKEVLTSSYKLFGDFNVDLNTFTEYSTYTTFSGIFNYTNYMSLILPDGSNHRFGYIVDQYSESFGGLPCYFYDINNVTYFETLSGVNYDFNLSRVGSEVTFSATTSGIWHQMTMIDLTSFAANITIGVESNFCTVSGVFLDYIKFNSGVIGYDINSIDYLGVINTDAVESDSVTFIEVVDLDIHLDNIYRLQKKATYYGTTYSWSTYNYQVTPLRSFVDFISIDVYPKILPATTRNYAEINVVLKDQYDLGPKESPILVEDDDDVGFINTSIIYTDLFSYSGHASTIYTSGLDLRTVTIKAMAKQEG